MIYAYGVSLPGTHHIKNNVVCQDSYKIIICDDNTAMAVVADGLGSVANADIGSRLAATMSADYCREHIDSNTAADKVLDIIKGAFSAALESIERVSIEKGNHLESYDTTLTLAVLMQDTLFYGHSGDGGIIALTSTGRYEQVTKQQRDCEGRVFPLFFSEKWEFAQYDEKVSSVFLATDGMLEAFFPIYIKNAPVNIHVSLAQYFMDNRILCIDKVGQEAVQERISSFMENIPHEQVNDDKTVVALINTAVKTKRQPKEYYQEPDWAELKKIHNEAWKKEAYPGLT